MQKYLLTNSFSSKFTIPISFSTIQEKTYICTLIAESKCNQRKRILLILKPKLDILYFWMNMAF